MELLNTVSTGFLVLVLVLIALALIVIFVRWVRRPLSRSFSLRLLSVMLPRESSSDEDPLAAIGRTEQLLSALAAISEPFAIEVAVHHVGERIHFYLAVPKERLAFAIGEIHGIFPTAEVEESDDYTIFNPQGAAAAAYLSLRELFLVPLRTYREHGADTVDPVLSTLSTLAQVGDGAALQVMVRPAGTETKRRISAAITALEKGVPLKEVLRTSILTVRDVEQALVGEAHKKNEPVRVDDAAVQLLRTKLEKPLFSVNIRVVSSAETEDRAQDLLDSIAGSFAQLTAPERNQLLVVKPRDVEKVLHDYIFREYDHRHTMVLNVEELASIMHLPTAATKTPRIAWLNAREAAPPQNLPEQGVPVGESVFRSEHKTVRIADDDRRRHLYLVGQTGTGKSRLIESMAVHDIAAGKGVCVIDPHGDLIEAILGSVPSARIDDVVVFDPGDHERPLGLNMLEWNQSRPEEKTFIVNEFQAIFNRLFSAETMGPMFEQYMRNALLLLMEAKGEPSTIIEIPRLFTDAEFRKRQLAQAQNPVVIDFWEKEAVKTSGEQGLANMTPYITSKFNNFIANDYVRPIVGQRRSSFNFRELMDEGKILLVNLSKGRIGDLNAHFLGMIVVGRILLAALSRSDQAAGARKDFYLYIDEFQNFSTDSIATILSEARKYGLCLILAHQFIAQLTETIKGAVFGNVGSSIVFRVGTDDASYLGKHYAPEFSEADLVGMENRHAIARLLVSGEPTRPFSMRTLQNIPGSPEVAAKLRELSRLTFGRPLPEVEAEILTRLRA